MAKTIWKFPFEINHLHIHLPIGAQILSAENQGEQIVLYALVDTEEKRTQTIEVHTFGTGQPLPDMEDLHFIDTVKLHGGRLMFHVFCRLLIPEEEHHEN